ncbi:Methionine aminopeptidase 1 [Perkinsus olseni]|uniref:Methionine aminopeptidase n=3 Tax=Perkinsus olseni TaxID=32597 RepID=A0A7J6PXK5_PEROL|nr:Methionine aminopeptidase 1 [Perkinsus olseni]
MTGQQSTCQGCPQGSTHCPMCSKPTTAECTLKCPTCTKIGVPPSYFCCQACFKMAWDQHKEVHKIMKQMLSGGSGKAALKEEVAHVIAENNADQDEHLAKFHNYTGWTGSLRPAKLGPQRELPESIARPDYAGDGIPHSEVALRRSNFIKQLNDEETSRLRESCLLGRKCIDECGRLIMSATKDHPVRGCDVDEVVHNFCVQHDCYPSPLNYYHFPRSVCVSVNEVICHGMPDERAFEPGDIVNVDITLYHNGMHADLNETYIVPDPEGVVNKALAHDTKRLVEGTYASMMSAIEECKPGIMYRDLGNTIQKVANHQGLSVVKSYCGHGVRDLFHCAPNVPHYAKNKAIGVMKKGNAFTVEPMLNLGTYKDRTWPDDWTSVTLDGKRSAQFEHTIILADNGVEILTARLPESPSCGFDMDAALARCKQEAGLNKPSKH